jgi:hypothetical protein
VLQRDASTGPACRLALDRLHRNYFGAPVGEIYH